MKELFEIYEKYKKLYDKEDFTDMIERLIDPNDLRLVLD